MIVSTTTIPGKGGDNLVVTFESGYYGYSSGGINFIVSDKKSHTALIEALHAKGRDAHLVAELMMARDQVARMQAAAEAYHYALTRISTGTRNPATVAREALELQK